MGLLLGFFLFFLFNTEIYAFGHMPLEGFGGPKKDQIVVSPVKDCDFRTSLLRCAKPTQCLLS